LRAKALADKLTRRRSRRADKLRRSRSVLKCYLPLILRISHLAGS
jgi:hypothetical protein